LTLLYYIDPSCTCRVRGVGKGVFRGHLEGKVVTELRQRKLITTGRSMELN